MAQRIPKVSAGGLFDGPVIVLATWYAIRETVVSSQIGRPARLGVVFDLGDLAFLQTVENAILVAVAVTILANVSVLRLELHWSWPTGTWITLAVLTLANPPGAWGARLSSTSLAWTLLLAAVSVGLAAGGRTSSRAVGLAVVIVLALSGLLLLVNSGAAMMLTPRNFGYGLERVTRLAGATSHPNVLGLFSALLGSLALGWRSPLRIPALSVSSVLLYATGSRTAQLALVGGVAYWFIARGVASTRAKALRRLAPAVLVLTAASVYALVIADWVDLSALLSQRDSIWRFMLDQGFTSHLIGNSEQVMRAAAGGTQLIASGFDPHSAYLNSLLMTGAVGAVAFALFLVRVPGAHPLPLHIVILFTAITESVPSLWNGVEPLLISLVFLASPTTTRNQNPAGGLAT